MKRFLTFLMTVMALFAFSTNVMAQQNVFLETEQTINGINNGWKNNGPQFTHYEGTTWVLKVTSMPDDGFYFRVRVDGWDKPMQPCEEDGKNVLQLDGELYALYPSGNGKEEKDFYGAERAWWVKGYKGVYDYLEIYVNLTEDKPYRGVKVVGKKNTVTPPTPPTPPTRSTITPPAGYYLVGNFFSPYNKADITPGPDSDHINYNRHYFKFAQNKEGAYTIDIPACLTAKMQILAADDAGNMKVYGPSENATYAIHSKCPATNKSEAGVLTASTDLSENSPYWNLTTRNDNIVDDDGMYTVSFTMDADGNPTAWTIQHDALTRVAYLLNTSYGATAQPIYDKRDKNEGAYTDNAKAFLHFNGNKTGYYVIDYVVSDVNLSEEAKKATPGIHATKSINNSSGTHDKLFFLGNDGAKGHEGKLAPNWPSFTLNLKGMKEIEYNANRGDNDLAKESGSYGMSGSFSVINNTNTADYPNSISLVGDAIPGTTNENGSWNWASKAAKMTYDANERCYKVTIETTDANYEGSFRFVGDHSQAYNWYEDTTTDESKMAKSDNKNATGHSCEPSDPNFLSYTTTGATTATEAENNINWNRKAGSHVVRLYIVTDDANNPVFKYTIETTEDIGIPFTYRAGKFIRTYSNNVAMNVVSKNVKVYEAYKYDKASDETNIYSPGTLHLRQLQYIPANVGVVLIGIVPASNELSDGDKLDFTLRKRTDDEETAVDATQYVNVWTKAANYTGQEWNNFLAPTVVANNSLGNIEKEGETVTYRYYGLGNYHSTKYYNENKVGDDYIGFFRLTPDARCGANKAYLRMPASAEVEGGEFGFIDYNSQFIGPKDENDASLAKMMIVFDDEEVGGVTEIKNVETVKPHHDNAYYTLQGIKVLNPTKGIYIHNGKKIVIK